LNLWFFERDTGTAGYLAMSERELEMFCQWQWDIKNSFKLWRKDINRQQTRQSGKNWKNFGTLLFIVFQ
jgi:hypothetical protein